MPKYKVSYTSTATFWITVDADSPEQVAEIGGNEIETGEYDNCDHNDGYFTLNEVEEINENQ